MGYRSISNRRNYDGNSLPPSPKLRVPVTNRTPPTPSATPSERSKRSSRTTPTHRRSARGGKPTPLQAAASRAFLVREQSAEQEPPRVLVVGLDGGGEDLRVVEDGVVIGAAGVGDVTVVDTVVDVEGQPGDDFAFAFAQGVVGDRAAGEAVGGADPAVGVGRDELAGRPLRDRLGVDPGHKVLDPDAHRGCLQGAGLAVFGLKLVVVEVEQELKLVVVEVEQEVAVGDDPFQDADRLDHGCDGDPGDVAFDAGGQVVAVVVGGVLVVPAA